MDTNQPMLDRLKLLGSTQETTSGTAATVSASDAVTFYDARMMPLSFHDDNERMPMGHYVGSIDAPAGKTPGRLTYRQELRYGDKFVPWLTGCGYLAATGVYSPTSNMANRKTWTFKLWEKGRVKLLYGASATCRIEGTNGGRVFADWTWLGIWGGVTDTTMPAQAPVQTLPYIAKGMTLTLAATAIPHTSRFAIDLTGEEPEERESLTAPAAIAHYLNGEINPTLELDPEARLVAQHDAYGLLLAGTTAALNLVVSNAAGSLTITGPRLQRVAVDDQTRGRRNVDNTTYRFRISSGDDAISIQETAA